MQDKVLLHARCDVDSRSYVNPTRLLAKNDLESMIFGVVDSCLEIHYTDSL